MRLTHSAVFSKGYVERWNMRRSNDACSGKLTRKEQAASRASVGSTKVESDEKKKSVVWIVRGEAPRDASPVSVIFGVDRGQDTRPEEGLAERLPTEAAARPPYPQTCPHEEAFSPIRKLLFGDVSGDCSSGVCPEPIQDTGNWNALFQTALELPEDDDDQCYHKWQRLTTVNRDFVAAAVTYGKTIISEYFLDHDFKSIKPGAMGGVAGGKKFVWRGILFKLADGSSGPYCGNDEAAAKGAGHDLRGATHYLGTRIRGLHYALQCLIDFKGFRMTAQALLPVDSTTLRYGTADGARSVHNDDAQLADCLRQAGKKLNLRTHKVHETDMYSACDIEGHLGTDGRHYLLDFSRSFPPESPYKVDHLNSLLNNGTPVYVLPESRGGAASAAAVRGEADCEREQGVKLDGGEIVEVAAARVVDRCLSIYWRMLRPEFVKGDGEAMVYTGQQTSETPTSGPIASLPVRDSSGGSIATNKRVSDMFTGTAAQRKGNKMHIQRPSHISERSDEDMSNAPDSIHQGSFRSLANAVSPATRVATAAATAAAVAEEDEDFDEIGGGYDTGFGSDESPTEDTRRRFKEGRRFQEQSAGDGRGGGGVGEEGVWGTEERRGGGGGGRGGGGGGGEGGRGGGGGGRGGRGGGGPQKSSSEEGSTDEPSPPDATPTLQNAARFSADGRKPPREIPRVSRRVLSRENAMGAGRLRNVRNAVRNVDPSVNLNAGSIYKPRGEGREDNGEDQKDMKEAEDAFVKDFRTKKGAFTPTVDQPPPSLPPLAPGTNASISMRSNLPSIASRPPVAGWGSSRGSVGGEGRVGGGVCRGGVPVVSPEEPCLDRGNTSGSIRSAYEVFIDYDDESKTEKGVPGGSSRRNIAGSFRGSWRSSNMSHRFQGGGGDCFGTKSMRGSAQESLGRVVPGASYEMLEDLPFERLGSFIRRASDRNIGNGAGGASGRAGPGLIWLEPNSSANMSYRFYPAAQPEKTISERRKSLGKSSEGKVLPPETSPEDWQYVPLSPDALSGFSRHDPDRSIRNQEVHDATEMMIKNVVPMVAERLSALCETVHEQLDLAIELHRCGVNMRHLGQVRSTIDVTDPKKSLLRDMMLTEMVARTLKNILRSFQRKWMKAERSTSEQGMRMLVVEFLNLVTGAHINSKKFWRNEVVKGVLQRFGLTALTHEERRYPTAVMTQKANVLKTCVLKLTEMQGLVLIPAAQKQFEMDMNPFGFMFAVADIQEIRPIVRAERLRVAGTTDVRILRRLNWQAKQYFITAYQSLPDDKETRAALLKHSSSLNRSESSEVHERPIVKAEIPPVDNGVVVPPPLEPNPEQCLEPHPEGPPIKTRVCGKDGVKGALWTVAKACCVWRTCMKTEKPETLEFPVRCPTRTVTGTIAGRPGIETRRPSGSSGGGSDKVHVCDPGDGNSGAGAETKELDIDDRLGPPPEHMPGY
eukprot:jgi/Undpi1/12049/HiC_scaffold_4.g01748.m1